MSRRVQTTEHLRQAALDELLDAGPRALTHAGVARRAYFSTAAVYQRWPDRRALLDDLVSTVVVPSLDEVLGVASADGSRFDAVAAWIETTTGDGAQRTMQAVAEVCFAARDDEALLVGARSLVERVMASVPVGDVDEPLAAGLRWWLTGYAMGHALLLRCGCCLPPIAHRIANGLQVGWAHFFDAVPTGPVAGDVDQSSVPGREQTLDDVADAIIAASRRRIIDDGVDEVTVRAASADAGVTTGALYRRWQSRSALLRSVIAQEGLGDQHRWLLDLLVNASAGFESDEGASALAHAANIARRVWGDPESRTFLLEMAVAAHTSTEVCERLAHQVHAVVSTREAEVAKAADAGIVNGLLAPSEITWFLQTPPVAFRLMSAVGIEPSDAEYQSLLRLIAVMIWVEEPGLGPAA